MDAETLYPHTNSDGVTWDDRVSIQHDLDSDQAAYSTVGRAVVFGLTTFMLSGAAGSGAIDQGLAFQALVRPASGVTSIVRRDERTDELPEEKPAFLSVQQLVESILQELGLNISETARVLRVERPTIYSWLKDPNANLRVENNERLRLVYELAVYWKGLGAGKLQGRGAVSLPDGFTLLGLMTMPVVDPGQVRHAMDFIATAAPGSFGATSLKVDVHQRRKALNFPERSREEQDLNLEDHNIHLHFDIQSQAR